MEKLPKDICNFIEKIFNQTIEDFVVTIHGGNKKGEGYIGEIVFASLKNKQTDQEKHLVIKKVFPSDKESTRDFLSSAYLNEIHFYTKIWPEMKKFRKTFPDTTPLEITPKCYGTCSEQGEEKVVLENLKFENYDVHNKKMPVSKVLYEKIFKLYGQFHAVSFAMKHYQLEVFSKLAAPLKNNWLGFKDTELCIMGITKSFEGITGILKKANEEIILEKYRNFIENGAQKFAESIEYNGPNSVILHGDCWSNNLLLKFDDLKNLKDIKLIDYQMCLLGTPVFDLQYTFYSGASKESLDDWTNLIKVYHNTLGESLKEYNLDVEDIYPYEELVKEWKEYSHFGFIMSILIWGAKFIDDEDVQDLDRTEGKELKKELNHMQDYVYAIISLIKHFYDNDFL